QGRVRVPARKIRRSAQSRRVGFGVGFQEQERPALEDCCADAPRSSRKSVRSIESAAGARGWGRESRGFGRGSALSSQELRGGRRTFAKGDRRDASAGAPRNRPRLRRADVDRRGGAARSEGARGGSLARVQRTRSAGYHGRIDQVV